MVAFHLTEKQREASEILAGSQLHTMLAGGSRSGKTFLFVLAVITRALRAPDSRHAILRFRFNHVKQSIILDTFPKVMATVYPDLKDRWHINKQDWYAQMPGGSEIWFGGLDDKERTEKILGLEFVTLYLNECSQIPYNSRNMAITRLAQKVNDQTGKPMPLRAYYDENPPGKGHWTYKLFKIHVDPDTKKQLDPKDYAYLQMNPRDNEENLSADYLKTLEALPPRLRKRFLEGEFADDAQGALFTDENFEKWRALDTLPEMLRIIVAVDPSGSDDTDNADNDEIGIVVCGLGIDGNGYVLEDLTCKAGPATWGKVATSAFERWQADRIVAEKNFGGAMVKFVIQTARPRTPYSDVTASRGKTRRAEPIASLCDSGKVRMGGYFRELEDELCAFRPEPYGYIGENSPNRADAMVWGMTALFPELIKPDEEQKQIIQPRINRGPNDWMRMGNQ